MPLPVELLSETAQACGLRRALSTVMEGRSVASHRRIRLQRRPTRLTGPPRFIGVPARTPTPGAPTPTPATPTRGVNTAAVATACGHDGRGRPHHAALGHADRLAIDDRGLGGGGRPVKSTPVSTAPSRSTRRPAILPSSTSHLSRLVVQPRRTTGRSSPLREMLVDHRRARKHPMKMGCRRRPPFSDIQGVGRFAKGDIRRSRMSQRPRLAQHAKPRALWLRDSNLLPAKTMMALPDTCVASGGRRD